MALTILFNNSTKSFSVGTTSTADTGDLRIYYNGSQFYDNWGGATNDISSGSALSSPSIPLNSDGNIKKGVYKFEFAAAGASAASQTAETSFVLDPLNECIDLSYDCFTPSLSVSDSTSYSIDSSASVDTITRTLTVKYPTGSNQADVSSSASGASSSLSINTDNLWTGAYNVTLSGNVTYTVLPSGYSEYTYYEDISGYDSIIVECNNDLCDIYCCLSGLLDKLVYAQNKNRDQYNSLLAQYNYASSLVGQYRTAVSCGKTSGLDTLTAKIKDVLNCDGCGCQDCNDEPSKKVYGVGTSSSSGGTALTVTDGTTTVSDTSEIGFSPSWFDVTSPASGEAFVTFSGASADALVASASAALSSAGSNTSTITSVSSIADQNALDISTLSGATATLEGNYAKVEYEISSFKFNTLHTTPEVVLSVPASRFISIHSATLRFTGSVGTPSNSPRIYLHTSATYSAQTELGQLLLAQATPLGVNEYAQFSDTIGVARTHSLGDDLYISASADPSSWNPTTAILTVYYAIG